MLRYTYDACLVLVVCCVGSGLWDELITRSQESCSMRARARVCVCVCVWILKPQQGGVCVKLETSTGRCVYVCVCVCVWILKPQQGGLVPIWAVEPKKTNWSYSIKITSSKDHMKLQLGLNIPRNTTPKTMASKYLQLNKMTCLWMTPANPLCRQPLLNKYPHF